MANDPRTGKPYVFGDQGWRFNGDPIPASGVDSTPGAYGVGVNQAVLDGLPGYREWETANPMQAYGLFEAGGGGNALNNFLSQRGLRLAATGGPNEGQYTQAFDANNNPVGPMSYVAEHSGDSAFGAGVGLMGLYGGAVGAGLLGGGGAAANAAPAAAAANGSWDVLPAAVGGGAAPAAAGGATAAGGAAAGAPSVAGGGGLGSLLGGGGVLGSGLSTGQVGGLLGAAAGALGNGTGLNSATNSITNKIDPRIAQYLFGSLLPNAEKLYQQQMADPAYMQGFNQMKTAGMGLLGQPIAGNPFASGMSLMSQPRMTVQPATAGLLSK